MSHTKEPWEAVTPCPGECCWHLQSVGNNEGVFGHINNPEMSHENARRIVACVNSCRGIPLWILELDTPQFVRIINDRSELLAALEKAESAIRELAADCDGDYELADELAAVIGSVKGVADHADQLSQAERSPEQLQSCSNAVHPDSGLLFQDGISSSVTEELKIRAATTDARCSAPAIVSYPTGSLGEPIELEDKQA